MFYKVPSRSHACPLLKSAFIFLFCENNWKLFSQIFSAVCLELVLTPEDNQKKSELKLSLAVFKCNSMPFELFLDFFFEVVNSIIIQCNT